MLLRFWHKNQMGKHKNFHVGIKALIMNAEGKILLLEGNPARLKNSNGKVYWDIPGGRIEGDDSVEFTLRKELKEETGVGQIDDFKFFHATIANVNLPTDTEPVGLVLFIYTVKAPSGSNIVLSDEHGDMKWCDPKEASDLLSVKYPADFTSKIASL